MEACRCLVNGLYQSQAVRSGFILENCTYVTHLADRIYTTSLQIFNPTVQQPIFPEHTPEKLLELLYLDLRITFVITAMCKEAQVCSLTLHTFFNSFADLVSTRRTHPNLCRCCPHICRPGVESSRKSDSGGSVPEFRMYNRGATYSIQCVLPFNGS